MTYIEMRKGPLVVAGNLNRNDIDYYHHEGYRITKKERIQGNKNGIKVISK